MKAETRKVLTGAAALTLTAAVSVGGTLAYLSKVTEKRANNFTFASDNLDAKLTEPEWDGAVDYEEDENGDIHPVYEDPDNPGDTFYGYRDKNKDGKLDEEEKKEENKVTKKNRPTKDEDWDDVLPPDELPDGSTPGRIEAQEMIPGSEVHKNPIITNTGKVDEWVAAKVTFVYADGAKDAAGNDIAGIKLNKDDFEKVLKAIKVDWTEAYTGNIAEKSQFESAGTWYYAGDSALASGDYASEMVFYYDTLVEAGESNNVTNEIFSLVTVKDVDNSAIEALEKIGGFAIYVEGYAVQDSAFDAYGWVNNVNDDKPENNAVFASGNWEGVKADVTGNGITKSGKNAVAAEQTTEPSTEQPAEED